MGPTSTHQSTLLLIPVYNAAPHLPALILRCRQHVRNDDILLINDGSTDASLDIMQKERVNYITFPSNRGKGAALKAGFDFAIANNYRSVLTIDADLQHLPEEIPRFLALDNGNRLVMGTRTINRAIMPFARWLTNNLTSLIISVFSTQRIRDSQSGYRLIPTALLRSLPLRSIRYDLESEMLFKAGVAGCDVVEAPISTIYEGSHSYINPFKDTTRFIRQIWRRIWV
jgi:hypothetical protein